MRVVVDDLHKAASSTTTQPTAPSRNQAWFRSQMADMARQQRGVRARRRYWPMSQVQACLGPAATTMNVTT